MSLPGFEDLYPRINETSVAGSSNNTLGYDIQTFRGGVIVSLAEIKTENLGQYYWSDGESTVKIEPPAVTFQGKEYLYDRVLTYASDGNTLFLIVQFQAADFNTIRSFMRFDGTDYEMLYERLSDLTPTPDFSPANMSPQTFAHGLSAANGKAAFIIEQYIIPMAGEQSEYVAVVYYDGNSIGSIIDSNDVVDAGAGSLMIDQSGNTECFLSANGNRIVFSAEVGPDEETAYFYYDGSTIHKVIESGVTTYNGKILSLEEDPDNIIIAGETRPLILNDTVLFLAYQPNSTSAVYGWRTDEDIFVIQPADEPPTSVYGDNMILLDPDQPLKFNLANENLSFLPIGITPTNRRLLYFEYAEGTEGKLLAIFDNQNKDDDGYELWVTYTPGLNQTGPSEPEPEPEPSNNIFSFLDHYSGWFYGNFGWMYDAQYPWVYSIQFDSWLYIQPYDNVIYFFYHVEADSWYLASLGNWGWLYTIPPGEPEGWSYVGY